MPSGHLRAVGPGGVTGKRGANDGTAGISDAGAGRVQALAEARRESAAAVEALRKAGVDVPADLQLPQGGVAEADAGRRSRRRQRAARRPHRPHASFKVPTGGGGRVKILDGRGGLSRWWFCGILTGPCGNMNIPTDLYLWTHR